VRFLAPQASAIRRGIRIALAVPAIAYLVSRVANDPEGVVYGSFLATAILGLSDFSGPWQERVFGPIVTAGVAAVAVVIGILASENIFSVGIVTMLVATTLSFLPTLRGLLAAGAPAVLLMYAIAITTDVQLAEMPDVLTGLGIGTAVTSLVLLVVFPRDNRSAFRDDLAEAMRAQADYVAARWLKDGNEERTRQQYRKAVDQVTRDWIGNPYRPSGAIESDHALVLLAARLKVVHDSLASLSTPDPADPSSRTTREAVALIRANADALQGISSPPSIGRAQEERRRSRGRAIENIMSDPDPSRAVERTRLTHGPQMLLAFATDAAILVRQILRRKTGVISAKVTSPAHWWTDLAVNASLKSPWARHALRTGIALTIAACFVTIVNITHGYWVLLGVISVLRIDAATTGAQAARALAGTVLGVIVGLLIVTSPIASPTLLWLLTPLAAFLVGYAPRVWGFAAGQASFSAFVLILLAAVSWPPQYATAFDRVVDIGIGVLTAAVVSLVMWPSRMIAGLRADLAAAIDAGVDYLTLAVGRVLGEVDSATLRRTWAADRAIVRRAAEAFDLTVVQRRDVDAVKGTWPRVAGSMHLLMYTGVYIATLPDNTSRIIPAHGAVIRPELAATTAAWEAVGRWVRDDDGTTIPDRIGDPYAALAHASADLDLTDSRIAASLATAVWAADWLYLLDDVAERVPVRS
jgi:uncharacterized membrane protein YccC